MCIIFGAFSVPLNKQWSKIWIYMIKTADRPEDRSPYNTYSEIVDHFIMYNDEETITRCWKQFLSFGNWMQYKKPKEVRKYKKL